jgi:uncharacterized membrane protein
VRLGRFEGLSDAVFGVAITLLVVDLVVPSGSGAHLLRAVLAEWPGFVAYVISSFTLGAV